MKNKSATFDDVAFEQKLEKISWFVRIRFIAPAVLWFFTTIVDFPENLTTPAFILTTVFVVIFFSYNSIIHLFVIDLKKGQRKNINLTTFILFQAFIDAVVLTLYIYFDGGIESPVFIAYTLLIALVAFLLGKKPGIVYVSITAGLYILLLLLEYFNVIDHNYIRGDHIDLHLNDIAVFSDGIFIVAFLFVLYFFIRFLNKESFSLEGELKETLEQYNELKEQYQDITDNAFDLIQSIDSKGNILYVNKRWKNLFGYSDDELKKITIFDLVDESSLQAYRRAIDGLIEDENQQTLKLKFKAKNGELIFLEESLSGKVRDGKLVSTREILRDITATSSTEKEKSKKAKELERLNESLVGRELKMIEMQKEIDRLNEKIENMNNQKDEKNVS